MKQITNQMIKDFKIMELGYDFAGYKVKNKKDLSFHHMIISHKESKSAGIGEGYLYWNGAILVQKTSHDYFHIINLVDPEIFYLITSELIDENIKRRVDIENLKKIRDLLLYFEREHDHDCTKKGHLLIRREYIKERVKL